jgi:hypothetical protein
VVVPSLAFFVTLLMKADVAFLPALLAAVTGLA